MDQVVDLLAELVAFDTTSARSNLALIDRVQTRLVDLGADCRRLPDDSGDKAGLLARFDPPDGDGRTRPPVVLSAHTDCVPVDGQDWTTDPFELTRDRDRLLGRGTVDMKGFIATVLAALDTTDLRSLSRPVILALSRDEELGALGAPDVVAGLRDWRTEPWAVVVGEPTSMRPVIAHKGIRSYRTVITGAGAHSSQPHRAANAVVAGARIVAFVDELAARVRDAPDGDARFDPPYTTFNAGIISGGTAVNIVPDRCELEWEFRPVPGADPEEIREQVQDFIDQDVVPRLRRDADVGDVVTEPVGFIPTLDAHEHDPAVRLVAGLDGVDPGPDVVSFGTDGGHFHAAGWSTVVCGPGSIDQAHRPDEFVTVGQLEANLAMITDLLENPE